MIRNCIDTYMQTNKIHKNSMIITYDKGCGARTGAGAVKMAVIYIVPQSTTGTQI